MQNLHELLALAEEVVTWCSVCNSEPATAEAQTTQGVLPIGEECIKRVGLTKP